MAVITKVKKFAKEVPHGTERPGIKGMLVDKGERYAAAYGLGFAKTYYGSKFIIRGYGADMWLGVGGHILTMLARAFGGSSVNALAPHLERFADAGIISALGSLGAAKGLEKGGMSAQLRPAAAAPALSAAGKKTGVAGIYGDDVLGMVPGAKAGPYLSDADLLSFSGR